METCKLCELYTERKIFTRLYEETSRVIVVQSFNAQGNKNPRLMAVLKSHTTDPTEDEKQIVEGTLRMVADRLGLPYTIEQELLNKEHYHRHAKF